MQPTKMKVFVVPGDGFRQVEKMFVEEGWELVQDLDDADLVQFVGGADVDPALYKQNTHKTTHSNPDRDAREQAVFVMAFERGIPMAGICRGGQFLNVMNGGSMWQDVDGHASGTHNAYVLDSDTPILVTGTHHQMMDPNYTEDVIILMTAGESTNKTNMSQIGWAEYDRNVYAIRKAKSDIEALYYRNSNCLCFQAHPEYMGGHVAETRDVYFKFIEDYLFGVDKELLKDEA